MEKILLYPYPAHYAHEHGELDLYRKSRDANIACKEAIEAAIQENYHDNCLDTGAVKQIFEQFGTERTLYVLANSVQRKDYDGRFSHANKEWAKTIPVCEDTSPFRENRRCAFEVDSHPGLTDLFVTRARKQYELARQQEKNTENPSQPSPKHEPDDIKPHRSTLGER